MSGGVWILFVVPCPTPDGRSARELYEKRIVWISDAMRDDARARGCRFHRAWHAAMRILCRRSRRPCANSGIP